VESEHDADDPARPRIAPRRFRQACCIALSLPKRFLIWLAKWHSTYRSNSCPESFWYQVLSAKLYDYLYLTVFPLPSSATSCVSSGIVAHGDTWRSSPSHRKWDFPQQKLDRRFITSPSTTAGERSAVDRIVPVRMSHPICNLNWLLKACDSCVIFVVL